MFSSSHKIIPGPDADTGSSAPLLAHGDRQILAGLRTHLKPWKKAVSRNTSSTRLKIKQLFRVSSI